MFLDKCFLSLYFFLQWVMFQAHKINGDSVRGVHSFYIVFLHPVPIVS